MLGGRPTTPLKNMKVKWDYYSQSMESHSKFHGSSHHQPVNGVSWCIIISTESVPIEMLFWGLCPMPKRCTSIRRLFSLAKQKPPQSLISMAYYNMYIYNIYIQCINAYIYNILYIYVYIIYIMLYIYIYV